LYVHGNTAETVWSALIALPLGAVLGIFHALLGSAPLLLCVHLLLLGIHRFRAEALRARGALVTVLLFAFTVAFYGASPLSFAPVPKNLLPGAVVAVLAGIMLWRWYARRSAHSTPSPLEMTSRIAIALVAVASASGLHRVLAIFANEGTLPPTLGG
jgi:hypothetical protein